MVFSFFKKTPQKMPERVAARPKAPAVEVLPPAAALDAVLPDLEFAVHSQPAAQDNALPPAAKMVPEKTSTDAAMAEFDRDFSDFNLLEIDVAHDIEPLQADLEQAVVLFANGQDAAARNWLEAMLRTYPGPEGRPFWHLLFDLLQIDGDRAAFDKLGVEFAHVCETSPPTWRDQPSEIEQMVLGPRTFQLQGILTGENLESLTALSAALRQKHPVLVECGRLIGCDDEAASLLAELLSAARQQAIPLSLDHPDGLMQRLNDRLLPGVPEHAPSWLLLLELLQRYGTQEHFEERAVDYAVTFELSPPSWDRQPGAASGDSLPSPMCCDGAHYLSGELKSCRFNDLVDILEQEECPVLDFSAVSRMDFFSAGQLVNRLVPYKAAGREIVIRCPNHLVAELMIVVGLDKQARIIVPKS